MGWHAASGRNRMDGMSEPTALTKRLAGAVGTMALLGGALGYWEGDSLRAYRDMGGTWTICGGVTEGVHEGQVATREECVAMNSAAARHALAVVDADLPGQPEKRHVALADFVYNIGATKWRASTALRMFKAGNIRGGCEQLSRWVYVQGRVVAWQVQRRAWERQWCLEGLPDAAGR